MSAPCLPRAAARHPLARLLLLFTALATLTPQLASAQQVKVMPKYRQGSDLIDDPVQLKSERKTFEAAYESYRQYAKEYRDGVKDFISREIHDRQKTIANSYQGQIDALDQAQFDLRRDAIARLESFIFRHRDHDAYTPDTLFRLAELYYEDTIAAYNRSQDNFQREMDLFNRGKLLDPPLDTERDFSRSVAIYKYLHWAPDGTKMDALSGKLAGIVLEKRWPNYKFSDAAMYLQGYCEYEGGKIEEAIATLSKLQEHYPDSTYIAEAWLRVGEMYFDSGEFEQAAAAYMHAADRAFKVNDYKNYALALYKLGWSNFQLYKYPEAVRWFLKEIEFEDANADKIKSDKDKLDLRKEAIEYLAKSLAEPSWDDDGCDDFGNEDAKTTCLTLDPRLRPRLYAASVIEPKFDDFPQGWKAGIQGEALTRVTTNFEARAQVRKDMMNGKPYTYDILVTYGNTLYDQAQDDYYRQAVLVLSYVIEHWPLAREAQAMQRKVIRAVDILAAAAPSYAKQMEKNPKDVAAQLGFKMAMDDQDRQVVERRRYLQMFGKDSEWYKKWGSDKDLAAQVDDTVAHVRMDFAQLIHAQAQSLRRAGKEEEALVKYAEASNEYEKLLKDDMDSPNAYELAWTLSETLWFAGSKCDAIRKEGNILMRGKGHEDEVMFWQPEDLARIKPACDLMKKSVQYYAMVRDWKGQHTRGEDGKPLDHKEEAGFTAIAATGRLLNARAAYPPGDPERLEAREVPELRPSSKQDEAEQEANKDAEGIIHVKPQTIDAATAEWLITVDGYIKTNPVNPKDDLERIQKLALQAAELLYKNRHFDADKDAVTPRTTADFWSARERFIWIINHYKTSKQASEAYKDLLTTFLIEHDYAKLLEWTEKGEQMGIGDKAEQDKLKELVKEVSLGAMAKGAEDLFNKAMAKSDAADKETNPEEAGKQLAEARKTFDKAGDTYFGLRNSITQKEKDYVKRQKAALMSAVAAYYRAENWDACTKVLQEAEQRVRAAMSDPKEKEDAKKALVQIIETRRDMNVKFFHIPEAIADSRSLFDLDTKNPLAPGYLRGAADMAGYNGNYDLAIQLDKQFTQTYAKDPKQLANVQKLAWRIQQDYQKKGDINGQIGALEEFIGTYTGDKAMTGRVFEAMGMIADIYESRGDHKNADKLYHRIVDAFDKGGFEKNGGKEATATAQSQFMLMKPRYDSFVKMDLVENTKLPPAKRMPDLQNQLRGMLDIVLGPEKAVKKPDGTTEKARGNGMFDEYMNSVATYGSQNWSYAAFLNRGRMLQYLARVIYKAPEPQGLTDAQLDEYHNFLDQIGGQLENQAIRSLETALKDAEGKGVVNQWVSDLRKAMNQYKPKEYPLLKDEKRLTSDPVGTLPEADKELR